MKPPLEFQNGWLTYRTEGDIAVFTFSGPFMDISTDLEKKDELFYWLNQAEADPTIKALFVINEPGILGDKAYNDFLRMLSNKTDSLESNIFLSREELVLDQFILHINASKKITITGLQGEVATPFFGIALAYDFRLVALNVVFDLSAIRKGVPPSGGVGFFLPRYIGQARATDYILSGRRIPARLARQLGLVNALLPEEDFEKQSIAMARKFSRLPMETLTYTKELLHAYSDEELELYLKKEYRVMCRAWVQKKAFLGGI